MPGIKWCSFFWRRTISQAAAWIFIIYLSIYLFIYLCYLIFFTSFSGHRPAQRGCARTGLRSHARCHPYPIPQPVKVGHTTVVCTTPIFSTLFKE